ncbi:hypothetical protein D3C79_731790 [compost metagenome]
MPDRVLHHHLLGTAAILEEHLQAIGDRALVRLQVFTAETRVLDHLHLFAQTVDARVGGVEGIFVMLGHQMAEYKRHRHHVLQAVVAIGSIGQRADLGDDANGRFLGGDDDTVDFVQAVAHLRVQADRGFAGGLGVELGRETDLEQHVLHHVAGQRLRYPQRLLGRRLERQVLVGMAERHVIKAPLRRGQHPGYPHLATQRDIGQAHTTARSIAGGPRLARASVGCMAVGA